MVSGPAYGSDRERNEDSSQPEKRFPPPHMHTKPKGFSA